jgi:transcriptional regulator with XRE-family HTH domain
MFGDCAEVADFSGGQKAMSLVAKRKKETTGFGARLRSIREAKGLTQEQVAERAGMAYQAVARIERGDADNPTWKTVQKLAEALGVEPNDFLSDDDDTPLTTPKRPRKK